MKIGGVLYASIPKIYCRALKIGPGDLLLWERDGEKLIATPVLISRLKKRTQESCLLEGEEIQDREKGGK